MERRQAVTRKAMVVEEKTKRKDTAQHTKEETKAMESFLRVRYGMTTTEVSLILSQYGAATIEMLRQGIHEENLANALQNTSQPQEEKLIPKELKQHDKVHPEESEYTPKESSHKMRKCRRRN